MGIINVLLVTILTYMRVIWHSVSFTHF